MNITKQKPFAIFLQNLLKAYAVIPIKNLLGQNIFFLVSLSLMFLFIYTHGYNPLTDPGVNAFTKAMVIISISLVPILFIICNPARNWVKKTVAHFLFYDNKRL